MGGRLPQVNRTATTLQSAAIVVVASGCAASYDANVVDVIADVVSTIPGADYTMHVVLGLNPTVSITDNDSLVLENAAESTTFVSGGRTCLILDWA